MNRAADQPLGRRVARSGFWSLVQFGGREIAGAAVFVILARFYLDQTQFGVVAIANVTVMFLVVLAQQGLGTAIIQRTDLRREHVETAMFVCVTSGFLLCLMTFLLSGPIASLIGAPESGRLLQVLSIGIFVQSLAFIPDAVMRRQLRFTTLATRSLLATIISGVAAVLAAAQGAGEWSLVVFNLAMSIISIFFLWLAIPRWPGFTFKWQSYRDIALVGIQIAPMGVLAFLSQYIDQLIVGKLLGPAALGLYAVAHRIAHSVHSVLLRGVGSVAVPAFSRVVDDRTRLARGLGRGLELIGSAGFPTFLGLAVIGPELIATIFGEKWSSASDILVWLCLGALPESLCQFYRPVLTAVGRPGLSVILLLASTVLTFLLGSAGAIHGVAGVAAGFALASTLISPLWAIQLKRFTGLGLIAQLLAIGRPFVAAATMATAVLAVRYLVIRDDQIGRVVLVAIEIVTGVVTYGFALRAFCPSAWKDLKGAFRAASHETG